MMLPRNNRLTERVRARVRAAVRDSGAIRLLVACSGGGDSVCLAHAVVAVARQEGWQVALGHVRHGLRADDGEDAALVERLAHALDAPVFVHVYPPAFLATNETALRQARYTALANMAVAFGASAVLTGHTRDDQAETVLLRLMRGSGVDGLAAIAPEGTFPVPAATVLRVLRPLLDMRRDETRAYCAVHALAYREDPTNTDPTYRRNWVRQSVMPLLRTQYPGVERTLARTADLMREDADYLRVLTDAAMARSMLPARAATVTLLNRGTLAAEPIALQRRVLRAVIAQYSTDAPRADRLEIVRRATCEGTATVPQRVSGVALWPANGVVTIGREPDVIASVRHRILQRHPLVRFAQPTPFTGHHLFTVADSLSPLGEARFTLSLTAASPCVTGELRTGAHPLRLPEGAVLALRNRLPGDRFHPNGAKGSRKVQDYLTDRDLPAPLRDELPILVRADAGGAAGRMDEIVAVIGYDIATAFAATAATATHILALHTDSSL